MTILYFVVALGFLVLAHEWGHFIIARKSGITVHKFSIGFGPKLFGFKKGETEYRISLIPLGGYVQLYGEDPLSEAKGDENLAKEIASSPKAFSNKSLRARMATVVGGPLMNIILALLFMPLAFFIGRTEPAFLEKPPVILGVQKDSPAEAAGLQKGDRIISIGDQTVGTWDVFLNWVMLHPDKQTEVVVERNGVEQKEFPLHLSTNKISRQKMGYSGVEPYFFFENDAVVGGVLATGAAASAGVKTGDKILSINGQPVLTWTDMTQKVRESNGSNLILEISREGGPLKIEVTPKYNEAAKAWVMGITQQQNPDHYLKKRYPMGEAIRKGTLENVKLVRMVGEVVGQLFSFQMSYKALGGPVQIAQATAAAARSGLGDFFYFMAFLSLQLGVMNLLPIPVLDGGHLFFMVIEGIRRKPISLKVKTVTQNIGLVFLLGLMVLVTFNDIDSVWGFAQIWGKIKSIF